MKIQSNKWLYDEIKSGNLKAGDDFILKVNDVKFLSSFGGIDIDLENKISLNFETKKNSLTEIIEGMGLIRTIFAKDDGNVVASTAFEITKDNIILSYRSLFEPISDWAVSHVLKVKKESLSLKTLNAVASIAKTRILKSGISADWCNLHMLELEERLLSLIETEFILHEETKDFWSKQLPEW